MIMGNICDYKLMESFSLVLGSVGQDWRLDVYQEVSKDPYNWENNSYIHVLNKELVLRGGSSNDVTVMYWLNFKK